MSNVNCLEDKYFVKFIPELNLKFKKTEATLLIGQLEYWFSKYANGFYKFMEPCEHPHYRFGDSWTEELSLSRKVLNKAFDLVGVRYKSKSAYEEESDKFKGKLYASYYDRGENKTYYIRNHDFLKELFSQKETKETDAASKIDKKDEPFRNGRIGRSRIYKDTTKNINIPSPPKSPSKAVLKIEVLETKREGEDLSIKEFKDASQIQSQKASPLEISEEDFKKAQKMRAIWLKETKDLIPTPSFGKRFAQKLLEALRGEFSDSLALWEKYCAHIGSSKFLTGQGGGKFQLWLARAITVETIEKVRAGEYGVNSEGEISCSTSEEPQPSETKAQYVEKIETHCEGLDRAVKLALLEMIPILTFKSWFEETTFEQLDSSTLQIHGLTRFRASYIGGNFFQFLERLKEKFQVERIEFTCKS